jgi:phage/plasmid-associated DNA primase
MQRGSAFKKAYLLQGEPHSGKTSYITLLGLLFGIDNISSICLQELCGNRFASGTLEGKLLNCFDDMEDIALSTVDRFKALTGSCTAGIEHKFRASYTGKISAVHVFSCNFPPGVPDAVKRDAGFWVRWEYLKFPNSYPVNPNFYEETFTDEMLSSFLNAVLWAMMEIRKNGLLVVSDVQTVMGLWNVNSDPLYDFLKWGFHPADGKTIYRFSKSRMYEVYRDWCVNNNIPEHRKKNSLTAFTLALQSHGFIPVQHREKGESYEVYESSLYQLNRGKIPTLDYHSNAELGDFGTG